MGSSVPYGLWEQPIDASIFGIQATWQGELRTPFAYHIRQPSSTAQNASASFHQFARLPIELQLHVIQFCDKPTLFRLMQTSHLIRTEATKLFFADPEAWYCIEHDWLELGGHPGNGLHDVDFLNCIQRLQVECGLPGREKWTDEYIRNFWSKLQCQFPQAKYIMLSVDFEDDPPRHLVGSGTTSWPPPALHRRVCQLCPLNINVFISILRRDGRLRRKLWQRLTIQEDDNETQELDECQNHPRLSIIPPHKPFHGQVGTCQWLYHNSYSIASQKWALQVFRLAAIERYHFYGQNKAFGCPAPNCDAWFERPEEHTTHVARKGFDHTNGYILREPYKSLFIDGEKRLEQLQQRHNEIFKPFWKWWGKYGSEQRKVAEKEFRRELEYDPLHMQGEPISKSRWLKQMENIEQGEREREEREQWEREEREQREQE